MLNISNYMLFKEIKIYKGEGSNLKKLINLISKYTYSMENHLKLLELDAFANNLIEEEPKIFESKYNELSKLNQFSYKMQLKIFTNYFIEKFFVYSQNKNKTLISNQDIVTCYSIANNLTYFGKENLLNKVFFYLPFEQFTLQRNDFLLHYYRLSNLFSKEAQKIIEDNFGLSLNKIMNLHYILAVLINEHKLSVNFSIKSFKKHILNSIKNISEKEIENFLNYFLISFDEFKNKHKDYRLKKVLVGKEYKLSLDSKNNPIKISWKEQSPIDKSLPKVSFFYPLIKDSLYDDIMILTSYTALNQSLKLERLVYDIFSMKNNFKGEYVGPAIEEYIKYIFKEFYKENNTNNIKIYGNEKYKIKGISNEFDAPDIIIELDDYIIFIESKTTAFHLERALKSFEKEEFIRFHKEMEKSTKNINRYLDNYSNLKSKKIYKIISFIVPASAMVTAIPDYKNEFKIDEDLIVLDLTSLEILLNLDEKNITKIIDNFILDKEHKTLSHYCESKYTFNLEKFNVYFENDKTFEFI